MNVASYRTKETLYIQGYVDNLLFGKFKEARSSKFTPYSPSTRTRVSVDKREYPYLIAEFKITKQFENIPYENTVPKFKVPLKTFVKTDSEGRVVVKGNLPYHSCYFDYVVSCVEEWDNVRQGHYYKILSVVKVDIMTFKVTPWMYKWMMLVENACSQAVLLSTVGNLFNKPFSFNDAKRKDRDTYVIKRLGERMSYFETKIYPNTEHSRWFLEKPLLSLIPKDAANVMHREDGDLIIKDILETAKNPNKSWILMIEHLRTHRFKYVRHKPSIKWTVISDLGEEPLDTVELQNEHDSNDESYVKSTEKAIVGDRHRQRRSNQKKAAPSVSSLFVMSDFYDKAFMVYKKLKITVLRHGRSVSFVLDQVFPSKRVPNASGTDDNRKLLEKREGYTKRELVKKTLCLEMGLLRKEKIYGGQTVYTFRKYVIACEKAIGYYEGLWSRASYDSPVEVISYEESKTLSSKQKKAIKAVAEYPLVNIVALPGRGKSFVIRELYKKYKNVAVVTRVASLMIKLKEHMPNTMTIESAIQRHVTREINRKNPKIETLSIGKEDDKWYHDDTRILIIDEAEDVDALQMVNLYEVFRNVVRIVHVLDPQQISPINPGCIALELVKAIGATPCTVILKKPFRFTGGDSKTESHHMHNDNMILKKTPEKMLRTEYQLTTPTTTNRTKISLSDIPSVHSRKDLVFLKPIEGIPISTKEDLTNNLRSLFSTMKDVFTTPITATTNSNYNSTVFISLTNAFKDETNKFVEKRMNPTGMRFYAGQRITVIDRNFIRQSVSLLPKKSKPSCKDTQKANEPGSPDMLSDLLKEITKSHKEEDVEVSSKDAQASVIWSHGVKNGEFYTIECIRDFDVGSNSWTSDPPMKALSVQKTHMYNKKNIKRCLLTACGKVICINPDYVDPKYLIPGWAITVDKSKGLEYDNVFYTFSADKDKIFSLNHHHVAMTRAKKTTYVLNTFESFCRLVTQPQINKMDTMSFKFKEWFKSVTFSNVVLPVVEERARTTKRKKPEEQEEEEESPIKKRRVHNDLGKGI